MSALDRASHAWIERGGSILADFAEFLSIPNVASDPKALRAGADWIVGQFRARGIEAIAHSIEGAAPVVMGRISGEADAPTIGIYAHYDGQPVADHRWASPPFTPTLRDARLEDGGSVIELPDPGAAVDPDWRIYARGSADDRAPIVALLAALDAVSTTRTTIVFLFEGEEELGSPHLGDYLATLKDQLAADLWLICDGPVHQSGRPQVALGVRGFAEIEIEVFGPPHDLHSGHYGETAVNPAVALAELLVSMRDADGSLHLADLAGPEPSAATVVAADAVPDPENLGFAPNPHGTYARRLLGPLLNVRGISAGDVGAASRNVIPATAIASIDLRLVAGQNPTEMIEAVRSHVRDAGYHLVDTVPTDAERRVHRRLAKVTGVAGYPGFRTDPTSDVLRRVIAAVDSAAGEPPILLPSFGGSVPLHHFVEHLDAPLAILPIANHDNNQHSENENMRLGNLAYGVRVMAALLGDL